MMTVPTTFHPKVANSSSRPRRSRLRVSSLPTNIWTPVSLRALAQPLPQRRNLVAVKTQPQLAASPQHILRGARPFAPPQIIPLALGQSATETHAEILDARGIAKHIVDQRAVSAHQ